MLVLQGKTYYEITETDPEGEGYTIDPVNSDGTISLKIQVNFNHGSGVNQFTLPSLEKLNGNWNIEIIVSCSLPEFAKKGGVNIAFREFINDNQGGTTFLQWGQSVSFVGASPTSYIASGCFNPVREAEIIDVANPKA